MKNYESPSLSVMVITKDDILLESDTFVDVSGLWDETTPEE